MQPTSLSADYELLSARTLAIPVAGVRGEDLGDTFEDRRGHGPHEGLDIIAARRTPVVAVDDGTIVKLFASVAGGLTIYQFDPDGLYAYYYAHLEAYADTMREGMTVRRGDTIGYVGSSGNGGETPHLHFAIFKLGLEKRWWEGTPLNPYPIIRTASAVATAHPSAKMSPTR